MNAESSGIGVGFVGFVAERLKMGMGDSAAEPTGADDRRDHAEERDARSDSSGNDFNR